MYMRRYFVFRRAREMPFQGLTAWREKQYPTTKRSPDERSDIRDRCIGAHN
ncbi:hypothetical protein AAFG13_05595 [Bradyrhizobium sp. B124]|uniref:hypothetical protein n=1 Tax=Bradyrhizobium sp. B124 TaxID=3140245 RepID=UPI0031834469